MIKINLRDYYPYYESDTYIIVPEIVAHAMQVDDRAQDAYRKRIQRNKAYFSLDCDDGIENHALFKEPSLYDIHIQEEDRDKLYEALRSLPEKQAKRIYAHVVLGISNVKIAEAEGVSEGAVRLSIVRGLRMIKKFIENIY